MADSAYTHALTLLARRELSAARLRQRLAARDFPSDQIDDAIARLREAGSLDDRRMALAKARSLGAVKARGRARVVREIEALGIDRALAREAVKEVFGELDEDALLEKALAKRLRGRIRDAAQFRRLHQYLMRQGFEPGKILAALKKKGGKTFDEE